MDQSLDDQLNRFCSSVTALRQDTDLAALRRKVEELIVSGLATYGRIREWAEGAGHVARWRADHPRLPEAYGTWYRAASEVLRLAREVKRAGHRPAGVEQLARACVKAQPFAKDFDRLVDSLDPSRPREKDWFIDVIFKYDREKVLVVTHVAIEAS